MGAAIACVGFAGARSDEGEAPSYVIERPATGAAADAPPAPTEGPRMDVLFLIDTTGSMSDEIEVVKEKMRDMVAEIASGDPPPRVRFGVRARAGPCRRRRRNPRHRAHAGQSPPGLRLRRHPRPEQ